MVNLFACSGPGAHATIGFNIIVSFLEAVIVGLLVRASLSLRHRFIRRIGGLPPHGFGLLVLHPAWWISALFPALCFGLFVLHPAWWISAVNGDCGHFKILASTIITIAAVVLVSIQATIDIATKRRTTSTHKSPTQ